MTTVPPGFELPGDRKSWTELTESCGGEWRAVVAQAARQRASAPADAPGPAPAPAPPLAPAPASCIKPCQECGGRCDRGQVPGHRKHLCQACAAQQDAPAEQRGPHLCNQPESGSPFSYSAQGVPGHGDCCAVVPRGLYEGMRWALPLPLAVARVLVREGAGIYTYYLTAAGEGRAPRLIAWEDVRDGRWAPMLDMVSTANRAVMAAAGDAIYEIAHGALVPVVPGSVPPRARDDRGCIPLPLPGLLPEGYLQTAPARPGETPAAYAARVRRAHLVIASVARRRPKIALVLGLSAAAPYVGPLRRDAGDPGMIELVGGSSQGKTSALSAAASLHGDPSRPPDPGMMTSWDATSKGFARFLGALGIFPAFTDETGTAGFTDEEWKELVFGVSAGASRMQSTRGGLYNRTAGWVSYAFSTGNQSVVTEAPVGRFAGIPARLLTINGPLTGLDTPNPPPHVGGPESDRLDAAALESYGHLGPAVLATIPVEEMRRMARRAAADLEVPGGGVPRRVGLRLAMGVAGAEALDRVLGLGDALRRSALLAAADYLDHAPEAETDRNVALGQLAEAMAVQRPLWPTVAAYNEQGTPREDYGTSPRPAEATPRHGSGDHHGLSGVQDAEWVYVFPGWWKEMVKTHGLDGSRALADMHARGELHTSESRRRRDEWRVPSPRLDGRQADVYKIRLAALDGRDDREDQDDDGPAPESAADPYAGAPDWARPETAPETAPAAPNDLAACLECGGALSPWLVGRGARYHAACGPEADAPGPRDIRPVQDVPLPALVPEAPPEAAASLADVIASAAVAPREAVTPGQVPAWVNGTDRRARWEKSAAALADPGIADHVSALGVIDAITGSRDGDAGWRAGPFAPWAGRGKGKRPPLLHPWGPDGPAKETLTASVTRSLNWERPYDGETVTLDRSGHYVAALSAASFAHGRLARRGPVDLDTGPVAPGYYLVDVYQWTEDGMPHPLGNVDPGGRAWVPAPAAALLRDLAAEGRWPDAAALDSLTGDPCRLSDWARFINDLRALAVRQHGRDSAAYQAVKDAYSMAIATLSGKPAETETGEYTRQWRPGMAQRLDWSHTIESQAAASLWRAADKCRRLTGAEGGPVALRRTDELVIPAASLAAVTTAILPGETRPPVRLDPEGLTLGTFKTKTAAAAAGKDGA